MEKWMANRPYISFLNKDPLLTYPLVSVKGAFPLGNGTETNISHLPREVKGKSATQKCPNGRGYVILPRRVGGGFNPCVIVRIFVKLDH